MVASDCWDSDTHEKVSQYASSWLWRYVQHNAKESTSTDIAANLTHLSKRDIGHLADIRLLLSDDVRKLIDETAPRIVSRLSKASIIEKVSGRSGIKGRIDWPRTFSERASAANDPGLFVYAKRSQMFDLPENRLFLYIIHQIHMIARSISTKDFSSLTWDSDTIVGGKWIDRVTLIAAQTARFLRNPYIARISRIHELPNKIIEQTKRSRAPYYRDLANAAAVFVISQNDPIAYLHKELKGNILEPLNRDTLFEIAVLFKIIRTATECGWIENRAGLIGSKAKTVCTLEDSSRVLKIYYQKLPTQFEANTKYGALMDTYELSDKLRRPDIILSFGNKDGTKEYCIIEVKRSMRRSYIVDGTYKLLGYLKDFEEIRATGASLRGILVGWTNIPILGYDVRKEVHLYSWDGFVEGLSGLLKS